LGSFFGNRHPILCAYIGFQLFKWFYIDWPVSYPELIAHIEHPPPASHDSFHRELSLESFCRGFGIGEVQAHVR
jgi:hypothetical protein